MIFRLDIYIYQTETKLTLQAFCIPMLLKIIKPLLYFYLTVNRSLILADIKIINTHLLTTFICASTFFYYFIEIHNLVFGSYIIFSKWFVIALLPLFFLLTYYFFKKPVVKNYMLQIGNMENPLKNFTVILFTIMCLIFPIKFFVRLIFV